MRNTSFDAVFFDFDGTLVDSAAAKRDSFYKLFPDTEPYRTVVTEVLTYDPDGPRTVVIPRMVKRLSDQGLVQPPEINARNLIDEYGRLALANVAACPELPGASELLKRLSRDHRVHIFSNTPHDALMELVTKRGWTALVDSVTGYPADKAATIADVLRRDAIAPERVAVVGDGISDRAAAEANGCAFFPIAAPENLAKLHQTLGVDHV